MLEPGDTSALLRVWGEPGIEILEAEGAVWLRGIATDPDRLLALLPTTELFERVDHDWLRRPGARAPHRRLPTGAWVTLRGMVALDLPVAAMAARAPEPVPLVVERAGAASVPVDPEMLALPLDAFARFVELAPRVRLERWRLAVSQEGDALVRGTPLPPLPGTRLAIHDDVALPLGYAWRPAIPAPAVRRALGLATGELGLWRPERGWERIGSGSFVPVAREAVRRTASDAAATGP